MMKGLTIEKCYRFRGYVTFIREERNGENEMNHDLKILTKYYELQQAGLKKWEIRDNDRNFQIGDTLTLNEWTGTRYTGRTLAVEVTFVYKSSHMLKEGYVILSTRGPKHTEHGSFIVAMDKNYVTYQVAKENGWNEYAAREEELKRQVKALTLQVKKLKKEKVTLMKEVKKNESNKGL